MSAPCPALLVEWRRTETLRPHEHTQLPPLDKHTRAALVDDIGKRGIIEPLEITAAGTVLNGRERLAAAAHLRLAELPVRIVAPADEVEHIILSALQRRHLSASQRAALALELDRYRELKESARYRQLQNLNKDHEVEVLPPRGKTRDHVARWAGVSARTVQDAATVQQHDPHLFARIKAGELAADLAARKVPAPSETPNSATPRHCPTGPST